MEVIVILYAKLRDVCVNLLSKMPTYKRLRKVELFQLCNSRGINSASCKTKADLIYVLEQYDMRNDELIDDNSSTRSDDASDRDNNESLATDDGQTNGYDDEEERSEYESPVEERDEGRGGDEMAGAQHVLRRQGDAESEPVAALRLKLALIQEERKLREEERLIRERDWETEQERRLMLGDGQLSTCLLYTSPSPRDS